MVVKGKEVGGNLHHTEFRDRIRKRKIRNWVFTRIGVGTEVDGKYAGSVLEKKT